MDQLILYGIARAVRDAMRGTVLHALTSEQQHEIADAISATLVEHKMAVDTIKPVPEQIVELEGRLKELARVYSDSLSPLACARVLVDRLNQGTPANDATNRALMAEIGSPTGDDRISANIVITSNNRRNTDFLHRLLGTVKEADPANTPRFNGGMAS